MAKFLSQSNVSYLWGKIKILVETKVSKENGKGLSTNDYTTEDKSKLNNIEDGANKYVHPTYIKQTSGLYKITVDETGHVSTANAVTKEDITGLGIVEGVTYDKVTQNTDGLMDKEDKKKLDAFDEANTYAKKSDVINIYRYKGSVDTESALPTSNQEIGDTYNIVAKSSFGAKGMNVAWNGTDWDALGEKFEIEEMTTDEIDEICI